jgi:hypothetical protein
MKKPLMLALTSAAVILCGLAALPSSAQVAVPPPTPAYQPLADQQLDQLLGPIALYPDPLLAQIFPAATLPTEIVLADRYVTGGGDPSQMDQQPWDPSVQALARYPSLLRYLDNNLAWTTEVGQAFLNQQQQVMESIQRLRQSAENFGNLQSTPQQQVVDDGGDIEILPTEDDTFYLPVYQPAYVYFQTGYPVGFSVACAIGPWLNCDFDWRQHHLFFWDRSQPHPANWWRERPVDRGAWIAKQGVVWRPEDHRGFNSPTRSGDRGWNHTAAPGEAPHTVNNTFARTEAGRAPAFPTPARPAPEIRPASNGAFVGSDNAREVRNFSERGNESLQAVSRPEPARSEPAPRPAPSEGGGGGFHGGGGGGGGSRR